MNFKTLSICTRGLRIILNILFVLILIVPHSSVIAILCFAQPPDPDHMIIYSTAYNNLSYGLMLVPFFIFWMLGQFIKNIKAKNIFKRTTLVISGYFFSVFILYPPLQTFWSKAEIGIYMTAVLFPLLVLFYLLELQLFHRVAQRKNIT